MGGLGENYTIFAALMGCVLTGNALMLSAGCGHQNEAREEIQLIFMMVRTPTMTRIPSH